MEQSMNPPSRGRLPEGSARGGAAAPRVRWRDPRAGALRFLKRRI